MNFSILNSAQFSGMTFIERMDGEGKIGGELSINKDTYVALTSGKAALNPLLTKIRIVEDVGPIPSNSIGSYVSQVVCSHPYTRTYLINDPNFPYGASSSCVFVCPDGSMKSNGGRVGKDYAWDVLYPIPHDVRSFSWSRCRSDVTNVIVPVAHSSDLISGGDFSNLEKITFEQGSNSLPSMLPSSAKRLSCIEIPNTVTTIPNGIFSVSGLDVLTTIVFLGRSRSSVKSMSGYPWGVKSGSPIVFYCSDGVIVPQDSFECDYVVSYGRKEILSGEFADYVPSILLREWYRGEAKFEVTDDTLSLWAKRLGVLGIAYFSTVERGDSVDYYDQFVAYNFPLTPQAVAIPPTVEVIGNGAFAMSTQFSLRGIAGRISRLFIPYGVRIIGDNAFSSSLGSFSTSSAFQRDYIIRQMQRISPRYSKWTNWIYDGLSFLITNYDYLYGKYKLSDSSVPVVPYDEIQTIKDRKGKDISDSEISKIHSSVELGGNNGNEPFMIEVHKRNCLRMSTSGTCGNRSLVIPNSVIALGTRAFNHEYTREYPCTFEVRKILVGKLPRLPGYMSYETIGHHHSTTGEIYDIVTTGYQGVYAEPESLIISTRLKTIPDAAFRNLDFSKQIDLTDSHVEEVGVNAFGFSKVLRANWETGNNPWVYWEMFYDSPTDSNALKGVCDRLPQGCKIGIWSFGREYLRSTIGKPIIPPWE